MYWKWPEDIKTLVTFYFFFFFSVESMLFITVITKYFPFSIKIENFLDLFIVFEPFTNIYWVKHVSINPILLQSQSAHYS